MTVVRAAAVTAGHEAPVVRGADGADVVAAVERVLVGAPGDARAHVRVLPQPD